MRSRWLIVAAVVAAFVAVGAGAAYPQMAGQIVLRDRVEDSKWYLIDEKEPGRSRGDSVVSRSILRNDQGDAVARSMSECLNVVLHESDFRGRWICEGVVVFSDGATLTFAGYMRSGPFGADHNWAVTGGTGGYAGASGTINVQEVEDPTTEPGVANVWTITLEP